ncbi:uncharacterized protein LOC105662559 isoform X2 [Megachile rotundata]|uniref:uncharacterized protein LOC105662559 isoform X2 n=1 Tax=Megachile rotundata TaxID=143995 RepID=UPI003FD6388C
MNWSTAMFQNEKQYVKEGISLKLVTDEYNCVATFNRGRLYNSFFHINHSLFSSNVTVTAYKTITQLPSLAFQVRRGKNRIANTSPVINGKSIDKKRRKVQRHFSC